MPLFPCLSLCCYLGWFYDSAFVNPIAITMAHKYLCDRLISSPLGKLSRNGRAGSYGRLTFSLLRNLLVDFHHGWTSYSPSSTSSRTLDIFSTTLILTMVRWNLYVYLIYNSLIASETECFSMCFLTICVSSFENSLFFSRTHLSNRNIFVVCRTQLNK